MHIILQVDDFLCLDGEHKVCFKSVALEQKEKIELTLAYNNYRL